MISMGRKANKVVRAAVITGSRTSAAPSTMASFFGLPI